MDLIDLYESGLCNRIFNTIRSALHVCAAIGSRGRLITSAPACLCCGNSFLAVFDLERHKLISLLRTGSHPDSVAFDSALQRVYTADVAGALTVIHDDSANKYRVLDHVRTHFGAHTLIVDPVLHQINVAYSSLLTRPRITVFTALTGRLTE